MLQEHQSIPDMIEYRRTDAHGTNEFLKIERIHSDLSQIADGRRSQVLQFNTQQRATEHISIASLIHEKLDKGDDFRTLLNLIKENQGIAWL